MWKVLGGRALSRRGSAALELRARGPRPSGWGWQRGREWDSRRHAPCWPGPALSPPARATGPETGVLGGILDRGPRLAGVSLLLVSLPPHVGPSHSTLSPAHPSAPHPNSQPCPDPAQWGRRRDGGTGTTPCSLQTGDGRRGRREPGARCSAPHTRRALRGASRTRAPYQALAPSRPCTGRARWGPRAARPPPRCWPRS